MRALIVVDIQNDFLPGGALAVPRGDETIAVTNRLLELRGKLFSRVVATQDWHPAKHGSFASAYPGRKPFELSKLAGLDQVLWPDHCVQNSRGAEFAAKLNMGAVDAVMPKGTDPGIDSYSGFFDNGHKKATGLDADLKNHGIREVWVLGLATDYCVKFTALDALKLGYAVTLIEDGCRAVNLKAGDGDAAIAEMRAAGIRVISSAEAATR